MLGQALQLLEIRSPHYDEAKSYFLRARSNLVAAHCKKKGLEIQVEFFSSHFEARYQRQHPLALEKASENEFYIVAKFL